MRFQLSLTSIVVPKGTDKVVIAFIARGRRPPDPAKTGAGPDPASPRRSAARPRPTARATPADPLRAARLAVASRLPFQGCFSIRSN